MDKEMGLVVRDLSFRFGVRGAEVLSGVSLTAPAGGITAIVGPNGCGKTTLLRIVAGELTASAGEVRVEGKLLREMRRVEAARKVALVPQGAASGSGTAFRYSVREMVMMGRYAHHAGGGGGMLGMQFEAAGDEGAADAAMWAADVHHLAGRAVTELSGGERQRVAIARALAQETPVLLLDEPTAALDLFHVFDVLEHLKELATKGRTVVVVTHDLRLAGEWAEHVVVMDGGKVAAEGGAGEVLVPSVLEPIYQVRVERGGEGGLRFSRRVPGGNAK